MRLNLHFNIERAILFTPRIFETWIKLLSEIYLLILLTSSLNNSIMVFLSSFSNMDLSWFNVCFLSSTSSRFLSNSILLSLNLFSDSFFFCQKSMMLDVWLPDDNGFTRLITFTRVCCYNFQTQILNMHIFKLFSLW